MSEDKHNLRAGFLLHLSKDVQAVLDIIPQTIKLTYPDFFEVKSCGEILLIPIEFIMMSLFPYKLKH